MLVHDLGTDAFVNDAHQRGEEVDHWVCLLVVVALEFGVVNLKGRSDLSAAGTTGRDALIEPPMEVPAGAIYVLRVHPPSETPDAELLALHLGTNARDEACGASCRLH